MLLFITSNSQVHLTENSTYELINDEVSSVETKATNGFNNNKVLSRQTVFSSKLKNKLDLLVRNFGSDKTQVSYTIYNISTKEKLHLKGDVPNVAASSFKTYLATYIFYLIENDILDSNILSTLCDSINCKKLKRFITTNSIKDPNRYWGELHSYSAKLENIDLCKMLFISDNKATEKLIKLLPGKLNGLNDFLYEVLEMKNSFIWSWKNIKSDNNRKITLKFNYANTLTTNDQTEAWKKIFIEQSIVTDEDLFNKLADLVSYSYVQPLDNHIKAPHYLLSKHGQIDYRFWGNSREHASFNDGGLVFGYGVDPKYIIQIQILDPPCLETAKNFTARFNYVVWNYFKSRDSKIDEYTLNKQDVKFLKRLTKSNAGTKNTSNSISNSYKLISVLSLSNKLIKIKFHKKIKKSAAENKNNYYIRKLNVKSPTLENDYKTVLLPTSSQLDTLYRLDIRNIQDIEGNYIKFPKDFYFLGKKEENKFITGIFGEQSYYHRGYGLLISYLYHNKFETSIDYSDTDYDREKINFELQKRALDLEFKYWLIRKNPSKMNCINVGLWSKGNIEMFEIDNTKASTCKHLYYGGCVNIVYKANRNWTLESNLKIGYSSYFVDKSNFKNSYYFEEAKDIYSEEYSLSFNYKIHSDILFLKIVQYRDYQPLANFDNFFKSKKIMIGYKFDE